MADAPKPQKPVSDPSEKINWGRIAILTLLSLAGIGIIVLLAHLAPAEHKLDCDQNGSSSLIGFGRCHEE